MVRKFGISLDESVADAIEERLEYGDKRSERIEDLIIAGLAVEQAIERENVKLDISRTREVRSYVRQVFAQYEE